MARPAKKIDLNELEKLYGMQCTDREVAAYLGISVKTLERRKKIQKFADVMDAAKAKGRVRPPDAVRVRRQRPHRRGDFSGQEHSWL